MAEARERFCRAQAATGRALCRDPRFALQFVASSADGRVTDREIPMPGDPAAADLDALRGLVDLEALKHRHHQPQEHDRHAPAASAARALYDWAEEARISVLADPALIGVTRNLDASLERRCRDAVPDGAAADVDTPLAMAAGLWLREQLTGRALPETASRIVGSRRHHIAAALMPLVADLQAAVATQARFARQAARLPAALGIASEHETGASAVDDAGTTTDDATESAAALSGDAGDSGVRSEAGMVVAQSGESDSGTRESAPSQTEDEGDQHTISLRQLESGAQTAYRVFTRAYDETIRADTRCDRIELDRLYQQLGRETVHQRRAIMRLARRLERALQTRQRRRWVFEQEDGVLDPARLASVVADPAMILPFRQEEPAPFPDTALTLLIDCSGSMRGRPIRLAALCAIAMGEALARCTIRVEVLGFSTRFWQGGESGKAWARAGRPANPGRLNDLRHIIFKGADEPWRRTRRNLGLLLQDDLLKENIDGEALQWAFHRLAQRREQRRLLMVISDGLPRDGMTRDTNPTGFLEAHLQEVIHHIEARSPVELTAIGIGHDVTPYYRNSVTIPTADRLGAAMVEQLLSLFAR